MCECGNQVWLPSFEGTISCNKADRDGPSVLILRGMYTRTEMERMTLPLFSLFVPSRLPIKDPAVFILPLLALDRNQIYGAEYN